jgi:hypothetical protein
LDPGTVSTAPEPSFVSFVANLGIALPNVTPRQPLDKTEEEYQDQEEDYALPLWIIDPLELHQLPKNL